MRPNVEADETGAPGLLKFTVLNKLKNSARNWMFISVVKRKFLKNPRSTVWRVGPKYSPRRVSPNVPFGLTAKAAGLNQTGGSDRSGGPNGDRGEMGRLVARSL